MRQRLTSMVLLLLSCCASAHELTVVYTGEVRANVSGGIDQGARYLDNLDVQLEIDIAELTGSATGTLFLYGLYNNGTTLSDELVGDFQVVSNIEAQEAWRIYELWYEFGGRAWSVRTGLYDLNSEFDVNHSGDVFHNSSQGIGAAFAQTSPSIFPVSALAIRAAYEMDRATVRLAILDGVAGDPEDPSSNAIDLGGGDGILGVAELDLATGSGTRIWMGGWRYTRDFDLVGAPGRKSGNDGWYAGIEHSAAIAQRNLKVFVRYGVADETVNALDAYLGLGMTIDGLFPRRPNDRAGLALARAEPGDPYRSIAGEPSALASAETVIELTYRFDVTEKLALQPNVQYVVHPSASIDLENAIVPGLRFEWTL